MLFSLLINAFEIASEDLRSEYKAKKLAKKIVELKTVTEDSDDNLVQEPPANDEVKSKQTRRECLEVNFRQFIELLDQESRETRKVILCYATPETKWRKVIIKITRSRPFEYFIITMIILACAQLVFIDPEEPIYSTIYSVTFSPIFLPATMLTICLGSLRI